MTLWDLQDRAQMSQQSLKSLIFHPTTLPIQPHRTVCGSPDMPAVQPPGLDCVTCSLGLEWVFLSAAPSHPDLFAYQSGSVWQVSTFIFQGSAHKSLWRNLHTPTPHSPLSYSFVFSGNPPATSRGTRPGFLRCGNQGKSLPTQSQSPPLCNSTDHSFQLFM